MSPKIFLPFIAELIKWNKSINLIHDDTIKNIHSRHILDSLQLSSFVDYSKDIIIDIGSGAGLPGMILAIDGASNVHLIEPTSKKNVFLNHIKNLYRLPVTIHECGWTDVKIHNATVVTSRAFSSLNNLLEAMVFVSRETIDARGIFLKGEKIEDEIAEAKNNWNFQYELSQNTIHENGFIIKVWNVCKK
ncbi:MAG: 16S rRNA (guanine(527)-N(7))-methyltransferase RsmG [Alphaproteobacteria bacterium]